MSCIVLRLIRFYDNLYVSERNTDDGKSEDRAVSLQGQSRKTAFKLCSLCFAQSQWTFRDKSGGNMLRALKTLATWTILLKDIDVHNSETFEWKNEVEKSLDWSCSFQREKKNIYEKRQRNALSWLESHDAAHASCTINPGNIIAADSSMFFLPRFFRRYLDHVIIADKYFS